MDLEKIEIIFEKHFIQKFSKFERMSHHGIAFLLRYFCRIFSDELQATQASGTREEKVI